MGWGSLRWNGKHTIIFREAPHYMARINKVGLDKEGRCSPHALLTMANPGFQLETKYLEPKTQADLRLFKRHKNFCSKAYKREIRKYYESLGMKNVLDSKEFWKTMRPFLSDKNSFLADFYRKNSRLYLMALICLKNLLLFLKMLLCQAR